MVKLLQTVAMVKDCQETIRPCLDSWIKHSDRVVVFVDNKTTDNTSKILYQYLKKYTTKKLSIRRFKFTTFSDSRNYCLDDCYNEDYFWTFMPDDSFEIIGEIRPELEVYKYKKTFNSSSIILLRNNHKYSNILIFKTLSRCRFTGVIHEQLTNTDKHMKLNRCYLRDLPSRANGARTRARQLEDAKVLKQSLKSKDFNFPTSQNLFFLGNTLFNLYVRNLCSMFHVIDAYEKYFKYTRVGEQAYHAFSTIALIYINECDNTKAIEYYIKSIVAFPERSGESYWFIYLLTRDEQFLEKAFQNLKHKGTLAVDEKIYDSIREHYKNKYYRKPLNQLLESF